jgi:hypothetical protein
VLVPDARGVDRFVRVTWHAADELFVISTWDGEVCTGAVRVAPADLGDLVALLTGGIAATSQLATG